MNKNLITTLTFIPSCLYAFVLDDFTCSEPSCTYTTQNNEGVNIQVERDLPSVVKSKFSIIDNKLVYREQKSILPEKSSDPYSFYFIGYDFSDSIDTSILSNLKFNMDEMSASFTSVITLYDTDGNILKYNYFFDKNENNHIVNFNSGFANTRAISMHVNLTTIPDLEFGISSIELEAVPEPFSINVLGIGIATFMRKRRQKIKMV